MAMLSNLNTLIEVEQEGKRAIEECLANGKNEFGEIFRKHLEEKDKFLKKAQEEREALKKQFIELQGSIDVSYEEFDQSQLRLQNLVRISSKKKIGIYFKQLEK